MISYACRRPVENSYQDFHEVLLVSTTSIKPYDVCNVGDYDWNTVNLNIRNTPINLHLPLVKTLIQNAGVIKHVLRTSIIPKVGDRVNITQLLSVVTYVYMTGTEFNATDMLIRCIENLTTIRNPRSRCRQNLALKHIIVYFFRC